MDLLSLPDTPKTAKTITFASFYCVFAFIQPYLPNAVIVCHKGVISFVTNLSKPYYIISFLFWLHFPTKPKTPSQKHHNLCDCLFWLHYIILGLLRVRNSDYHFPVTQY